MKKYEVKITKYALDQMAEIRDYIVYEPLNPDAARDSIEAMQTEIVQLSQMPERFRPVDEEPWGKRGVRKIMVKNFYAYYWIDEEPAVVHIIAVAYAMRNQKMVLKEMDGYHSV